MARGEAASAGEAARIQSRLLIDAAVALLALLANAVLSVFKPWGLTPYGQRLRQTRRASSPLPVRHQERPGVSVAPRRSRLAFIVGIHAVGLAAVLLIVHLAGVAPH